MDYALFLATIQIAPPPISLSAPASNTNPYSYPAPTMQNRVEQMQVGKLLIFIFLNIIFTSFAFLYTVS